MRFLAALLPISLALLVGYLLGQRGKARALTQQQSQMVPLATALRNLMDADPMDAREVHIRRMEANMALDTWMQPE